MKIFKIICWIVVAI